MNRVVITGMGIVSCIGNDKQSVLNSLKLGKSGITFNNAYKDMGLRSTVSGSIKIDLREYIERKTLRFMGDAAAYAHISMQQAIEDASLADELISNEFTGIIMGTGAASPSNIVEAADILRSKGVKRIGPYRVTQAMTSTISACLGTAFKIKGINYSISSACATSAHCIGAAMEIIQSGKQNIIFAGGGEEEHWSTACLFDAMGALSTRFNDVPSEASRPYDVSRDGFVIAGGGGCLVLEAYEHAKKRGAKIYAELIGYAANSDGYDMVTPSGEGAVRCMRQTVMNANTSIDYINTHGTSTKVGDIIELQAIKQVFGKNSIAISSTKSLTGHSLGAAAVHESIYSLLMMENNFICASANIDTLDEQVEGAQILMQNKDNVRIYSVLSNSFGFGGTNASLLFQKIE